MLLYLSIWLKQVFYFLVCPCGDEKVARVGLKKQRFLLCTEAATGASANNP